MARLFVAVDLPERIRDDISLLYEAIPGARWVSESQIHITLRFIGDVDSPQESRIITSLRSVPVTPFELSVKGTGYFPPRKDPRVLWVGIHEPSELLKLQCRVERSLVGAGLEPESRKFHPHITVARLNGSPSDKIAAFITRNALFHSEPFTVSEFVLYESHLGKDGAHYEKVQTFSATSAK